MHKDKEKVKRRKAKGKPNAGATTSFPPSTPHYLITALWPLLFLPFYFFPFTWCLIHQHPRIQRLRPFDCRQQAHELRIVAAARLQARTLQFAHVISQH